MYKIDEISVYFRKGNEGDLYNHLIFSTLHSLKGHLEHKYFEGDNSVRVDITHDDGELYRFELRNMDDIEDIEKFYQRAASTTRINNTYKVEIKHPRTFRDWMLEQYEHDQLADLANHGAQAGCSGMIYYNETTELYDRYTDDLWSIVSNQCELMGTADNLLAFMGQYNGAGSVDSDAQFKNLMVWACAEDIAMEVTQGEYKRDEDNSEASDDE